MVFLQKNIFREWQKHDPYQKYVSAKQQAMRLKK